MNIVKIEAYTLPGCSACKTLKELFDRAKVPYQEITVNKDITLQEFQSHRPNVRNFPFVVIDGHPIGGLVEVVQLFVNEGLVSSKKK